MFLIGSPEREVSNLPQEAAEAPQQSTPSSHLALPGDSIPSLACPSNAIRGCKCSGPVHRFSIQAIDAMAIPEPYDDWLFAAFFPVNMHFLVQRRLGEQGNVVV